MKFSKRNICIVGFNDSFKENFEVLDYKEIYREPTSENYQYLARYPHLVYLDNLNDAKRREGFIIFINGNGIEDVNVFDFYNRKFYKQFNYIIIIKDSVKDTTFDKFSHIALMNSDIYWFGLSEFVEELYINFVKNYKPKKYQKERSKLLEEIYKYMHKKKHVKSKVIADNFNISLRSVQRYMLDLSDIYRTIGYDYKKNEYYVTK